MTIDHNIDRNATRERVQGEISHLARDSITAGLPRNWLLALRRGPDKHGLAEYAVIIDGLTVTVTPSRHGTGRTDPAAEVAAWRALVACVRRGMSSPRQPLPVGVTPLPHVDAELPHQIVTASWLTAEGDEVVLRHPRQSSRQLRQFQRRTRPGRLGMSSVFPLAGLAGVKIALELLAGAAVVIAGVATLPPGGVTSLIPAGPEASVVREHYVAPAPDRLAADASAPEPTPPHRGPDAAPSPPPTTYPAQLPVQPTVTPTPTPIAVPTVVPPVVLPTALPTGLTLASP